jgi:hypothetical protein
MSNDKRRSDAIQMTVRADQATDCIVLVMPGKIEIAIEAGNVAHLYAEIDKALKDLGYPSPKNLTREERKAHIYALVNANPDLRRYLGLTDENAS